MIFNCDDSKKAAAGDLRKKFFEKFNSFNPKENIGWKIIDSIGINYKLEFSNKNADTLKSFRQIKFLN